MYEPCLSRQSEFMKDWDVRAMKLRHAAYVVELRRNKRTAAAIKRRFMQLPGPGEPFTAPAVSLIITSQALLDREPRLKTAADTMEQAKIFKDLLEGDESPDIKSAVLQEMSLSLTKSLMPPSEIYATLKLPALVAEFCAPTNPSASVAVGILCNISADTVECQQAVVDSGVIPKLRPYFVPPLSATSQYAGFLLGNLTRSFSDLKRNLDVQEIRNLAISCIQSGDISDVDQAYGLAHFIGEYLDNNQPPDLLLTLTEALATLLKTPDPSHKILTSVLSSLDLNEPGPIFDFMDDRLIQEIIRSLGYNLPAELKTALSVLQVLVVGDREPGLICTVLDKIPKLLQFPNIEVRVSAYNLLQVITTGTASTVSQLTSHPVLKEALAGASDANEEIQENALEFVYALLQSRSWSTVERLLELDFLTELGRIQSEAGSAVLLVFSNQSFLRIVSVLEEIDTGRKGPDSGLNDALGKSGCYDLISDCVSHSNDTISDLSIQLLSQYFSDDDCAEPDEEKERPEVPNFQFS